jgi:hypothetical protein
MNHDGNVTNEADRVMPDVEDESGREPSAEQIVAAIRVAGWLLEQETAQTLSDRSFYVTMGRAFPDPDEPSNSRELDVVGYREIFRDDDRRMSIAVQVLAECKQSSTPYVLIGAPGTATPGDGRYAEQLFRFPSVRMDMEPRQDGSTQVRMVPARRFLGLTDLPANPWSKRFVATQMTRMKRMGKQWRADNEGIFTSLVVPLAKALTHFRSEHSAHQQGPHDRKHGWASIVFFYPIVVTSATVYAVDVSSRHPEVSAVPWAALTRELRSSSVDGQFTIDVVHSAHLGEYLDDRVGVFADAVATVAAANPEAFITHDATGQQL